jgi:hypothetical protein
MRMIGRIGAFIQVQGLIVIGAAALLGANVATAQPAAAAPVRAVVAAPAPSCEAQADQKKLTGAAKTAFVKKCQAAHGTQGAATSKPLTAQQQKMKTCNAQASKENLKGDARRKFMSTCLKKGH